MQVKVSEGCSTRTCWEVVISLVVRATESVCEKDAKMDHSRINFTGTSFCKTSHMSNPCNLMAFFSFLSNRLVWSNAEIKLKAVY